MATAITQQNRPHRARRARNARSGAVSLAGHLRGCQNRTASDIRTVPSCMLRFRRRTPTQLISHQSVTGRPTSSPPLSPPSRAAPLSNPTYLDTQHSAAFPELHLSRVRRTVPSACVRSSATLGLENRFTDHYVTSAKVLECFASPRTSIQSPLLKGIVTLLQNQRECQNHIRRSVKLRQPAR